MVHSPVLLAVLAVLATARLTRLVNDDAILDKPRAWAQARAEGKWAYLITCPWCISIYAGAATAGATYAWHAYWPVQVGLLGLAASYCTGLLALTVARMEDSP